MTETKKKPVHKLALRMTPRLEAALKAGDPDSLRALLSTWNETEMHELHRDLHIAYDAAVCDLDAEYRWALRHNGFLPEVTALWEEYREALLVAFTEIHQELGFYLDKRKGTIQ